MPAIFDSLKFACLLGLVAAIVLIAVAATAGHGDAVGVTALVLRFLHVLAAAVWIGLIAFMNLIHIPAVEAADDQGRAAIVRGYVPKVAASFAHLAHATVLSGLLLLVPTGYALAEIAFGAKVFVPSLRAGVLGVGALGGLVMWAVVQFAVTPKLRLIADPATASADRASARVGVKRFARLNLALMLPVTLAMIAAAHLV